MCFLFRFFIFWILFTLFGFLFKFLTWVPYSRFLLRFLNLGSLSSLGSLCSLGSLLTSLIKLGARGVFYVPLVALARLFGKLSSLSLSFSLSPYSVLLGAWLKAIRAQKACTNGFGFFFSGTLYKPPHFKWLFCYDIMRLIAGQLVI